MWFWFFLFTVFCIFCIWGIYFVIQVVFAILIEGICYLVELIKNRRRK